MAKWLRMAALIALLVVAMGEGGCLKSGESYVVPAFREFVTHFLDGHAPRMAQYFASNVTERILDQKGNVLGDHEFTAEEFAEALAFEQEFAPHEDFKYVISNVTETNGNATLRVQVSYTRLGEEQHQEWRLKLSRTGQIYNMYGGWKVTEFTRVLPPQPADENLENVEPIVEGFLDNLGACDADGAADYVHDPVVIDEKAYGIEGGWSYDVTRAVFITLTNMRCGDDDTKYQDFEYSIDEEGVATFGPEGSITVNVPVNVSYRIDGAPFEQAWEVHLREIVEGDWKIIGFWAY